MSPSFSSRLALALALASGIQAIQIAYLNTLGDGVSGAFFASHALVVVAVQILLAVALGGLADGRVWAAAVFCVPVALAAGPLFDGIVGAWSQIGFLVACVPACIAWGHYSKARAAPLATGLCEGAAGAQIAWFHRASYEGRETPLDAFFITAAIALALFVAALLASRLPARIGMPRTRNSLAIAAAGAVLAFVAGPLTARPPEYAPAPVASSGGEARPSSVLIVLDTLSARHLAVYGYERETMPELEAFAEEHGFAIVRSIANSSWTLPSHASMFTGLYPSRHGARHPGVEATGDLFARPLGKKHATLAESLASAGYWTVSIAANYAVLGSTFGLDRGFEVSRPESNAFHEMKARTPWHPQGDHCSAFAKLDRFWPFRGAEYFGGVHYRRAASITDEALGAVERAGDAPFFLFLNYMDPHGPYVPPVAFDAGFPPEDETICVGLPEAEDPDDPAAMAHLRDLYDSELRYLDREVVRLLRGLAERPDWEDLLVVITSDHGESLGEHGIIGHRQTLNQIEIEVPLFIKPGRAWAGAPAPPASELGVMQSVDIYPTVLEHAGVEVEGPLDGSAWGGARDEWAYSWLFARASDLRTDGLYAETLRAVERHGWKLISASGGGVEVFDLESDPGELRDRAADAGAIRAEFEIALEPLEADDGSEDGAAGLSKAELEMLRALGYASDE